MEDQLHVGEWLVHPRHCRIVRGDRVVRVRAKVMDLLVFLAAHAGEVVTKDAILDGVWRTDAVSESALTRTMTELRQALGDDVERPAIIETIPKRGYRLLAPIRLGDPDPPPPTPEATPALHRVGFIATGVGVALVVLLAALLFNVGHTTAQIPFAGRTSVLITAFDNTTGEAVLDGAIEYALTRELTESSFISVASRERVDDALQLMNRPVNSRIDRRIAREICLRDGAIRALVVGRIDKFDGRYIVNTQVIEPHDDRVVGSFGAEAVNEADLLAAIRRAGLRIRQVLGESRESLQSRAGELAKVTTPSLRALQRYTEAAALMRTGGSSTTLAAERLLRDALDHDPGFAAAHMLLAFTLLGERRPSDEYLKSAEEALRLADSSTDSERHFIRGSVHWLRANAGVGSADDRGEYEASIAEYEALLNLSPEYPLAAGYLMEAYSRLGRPQEHAAAVRRLADLRPNDVVTNVLASVVVVQTEGVKAGRVYIDRAAVLLNGSRSQRVPGAMATYVRMFPVHELWVRRDAKRATALLDGLGTANDGDPDASAFRRGYLRLALGQAARAEEAFAQVADGDQRALGLAAVALARERPDRLAAIAHTYGGGDLAAVSFLVRAGALDDASRLLSRLHGPRQHLQWAAAEIDEARGKRSVVRTAVAAGVPWTHTMKGVRAFMYSETLARAALRDGDAAGAIRLLEETGAAGENVYTQVHHTGYFWMRTRVLLADVYRQVGRLSDARTIERDLLAALGAADPDFPMLVEVRKRVE